jgi:hypothetical protein
MNNSTAMGGVKCVHDLSGDPQASAVGIGPPEAIRQRRTFDKFQDKPAKAYAFFYPVNRTNVRMVQRCENARLPLETRQTPRRRS